MLRSKLKGLREKDKGDPTIERQSVHKRRLTPYGHIHGDDNDAEDDGTDDGDDENDVATTTTPKKLEK